MSDWTMADVCVIACAEAWRGDGEVLASPIGNVPTTGARLAQCTFEPDLVMSDGEVMLTTTALPLGAPPS
ncbi:MAG: CoA-transferase, partial [Acidimicrobiales bacterium]